MKKLYLSVLACAMFFCAYSQSLEAYPTSQRYLFNPYNRNGVQIDSIEYNRIIHDDDNDNVANFSISSCNRYQMYPISNDSVVQVYGVAIPVMFFFEQAHRPLGKQQYLYGYYWEEDNLSPHDDSIRNWYWKTFVDSIHVLWSNFDYCTLQGSGTRLVYEKFIYLVQKTDDPLHPVIVTDSVKIQYGINATGWNRLRKPKLYNITETDIYHSGGYIVPTLEVYFDRPHNINDTFFVGNTKLGWVHNLCAVEGSPIYWPIPNCWDFLMYDPSSYSSSYSGFFRTNGLDFTVCQGGSICEPWTPVQYPGMALNLYYGMTAFFWGGPFAIVAPPPCMPAHDVRMTQVGYDSATVEWDIPVGVSHCRLEYGPQGFASGTGVVADSLTEGYFRLLNLEENTGYEVRVSCWCTYEEAYSEAVSVVFRTEYRCPPIQGLASIVVDDSTIAMVWQMADSADYSEVEYGAVGFAEGEGTLVTNITRNYGGYGYVMISGLTPGTAYEIRMRNYCGHSDTVSQWFCIDTVTTGGNPMVESIDEGWRGAVTLSPNPATTRFSLESPVAIARVVVTDLSGRIVYDKRMNSNTATIATEGWPKGLVLVAIETERGVLLRKLMIK